MNVRGLLAGVVLAATALTTAGCAPDEAPDPAASSASTAQPSTNPSEGTGQSVEGTVLRLRVNGTDVEARMVDNATAREFVQLLPLTIGMSDMLGREAYGGGLPAELPDDGPRRTEYAVGELVYWPPTNGLAVYYRHSGTPVPEPGLIPLGAISDGVDAFNLSETGTAEVTIQVAD